ncbi:MAG TPA: hypothetical protein VFG91_01765 [Woeseiaceae bacterium]|nr:hypothetical protein [Woeseiaceae bacterium]
MGRRWARCWSLKPGAPWWDGRPGWLPGNGEEGTTDDRAAPEPPAKTRVANRVRLKPRRRIKRSRV